MNTLLGKEINKCSRVIIDSKEYIVDTIDEYDNTFFIIKLGWFHSNGKAFTEEGGDATWPSEEKLILIDGTWEKLSNYEIKDSVKLDAIYVNIHDSGSFYTYKTLDEAKTLNGSSWSETGVKFVRKE